MPTKLVVGIATILPVAWCSFFIGYLLTVFFSTWKPSDAELGPILMVNFGCVLLLLGLFFYYVRHVLHNDTLSKEKKTFWVKAFLMGAIFLMPIYWYRYIFRQSA